MDPGALQTGEQLHEVLITQRGHLPGVLLDQAAQAYLLLAGQPAELAPAYVFLASAESSYVIGETLNVNGGMPTP